MSPNNESLLTAYGKPFLIGSLAGSIASAITQPIDTVKVSSRIGGKPQAGAPFKSTPSKWPGTSSARTES